MSRDRMVVGFITTYAIMPISTYVAEMNTIQHQVIKFVSDGFIDFHQTRSIYLIVLMFLHETYYRCSKISCRHSLHAKPFKLVTNCMEKAIPIPWCIFSKFQVVFSTVFQKHFSISIFCGCNS